MWQSGQFESSESEMRSGVPLWRRLRSCSGVSGAKITAVDVFHFFCRFVLVSTVLAVVDDGGMTGTAFSSSLILM